MDQERVKTVIISVLITLLILGAIGFFTYKYIRATYPEIWEIMDNYDRLKK